MAKRKQYDGITPDMSNANKGTERGRYMVEASLRETGAGRSILLDKEGRIIAGNKTFEAASDIGLPVRIVETDGTELVAVQRTDLDLSDTTGTARKLAYYDNRASQVGLEWDAEQVLADLTAGVDLAGMFFDDELSELLDTLNLDDDLAGEVSEGQREVKRSDVPDAIWPTDNEWGVPLLDINMQADAFDQPWAIWGSGGRKVRMNGTWLFYTDDYRFAALWDDPSPVLNTGAVNAVEPNFSVYRNMPAAVALWQTYRKRWIARYWQAQGLRVFVDLNVAANHYDLNRLGVPDGWKAFCTRGYSERLDELRMEFAQAQAITGDGVTPLFMVYGGGKAVKAECLSNGWIWIPETMDERKVQNG